MQELQNYNAALYLSIYHHIKHYHVPHTQSKKRMPFSGPEEGFRAAPQERVVQSDFEGSVWPENQTQKDVRQTSWFLPAL